MTTETTQPVEPADSVEPAAPAAVAETEAEHRPHPTTKQYWLLAFVLAVVTAVEVAIPYIDALDAIKVPSLLFLGAVKFAAVVAFFMHLRFDQPLFRSLFLVGVFGALPLFVVMLLTFRAF